MLGNATSFGNEDMDIGDIGEALSSQNAVNHLSEELKQAKADVVHWKAIAEKAQIPGAQIGVSQVPIVSSNQDELDDLKKELEETRLEKQSIVDQHQEQVSAMQGDYMDQIAQLKSQTNALKEERDDFEQKLDEIEAAAIQPTTDTPPDSGDATPKQAELEAEFARLAKENSALQAAQDSLVEKDAEIKATLERVEALAKIEAEKAADMIEGLTADRSSLATRTEELECAAARVPELETVIEALKSESSSFNVQVEELKGEGARVPELEKALEDQTAVCQKSQDDNRKLKADNQKLEDNAARVTELEKELENQTVRCKKSEDDNKTLKDQLQQLADAGDASSAQQARIQQLEQDVQEGQTARSAAAEQSAIDTKANEGATSALKQELAKITSTLDQLRDAHSRLCEERDTLQAATGAKEALQEAINEYQSKNDMLSTSIDQLKLDLDTANTVIATEREQHSTALAVSEKAQQVHAKECEANAQYAAQVKQESETLQEAALATSESYTQLTAECMQLRKTLAKNASTDEQVTSIQEALTSANNSAQESAAKLQAREEALQRAQVTIAELEAAKVPEGELERQEQALLAKEEELVGLRSGTENAQQTLEQHRQNLAASAQREEALKTELAAAINGQVAVQKELAGSSKVLEQQNQELAETVEQQLVQLQEVNRQLDTANAAIASEKTQGEMLKNQMMNDAEAMTQTQGIMMQHIEGKTAAESLVKELQLEVVTLKEQQVQTQPAAVESVQGEAVILLEEKQKLEASLEQYKQSLEEHKKAVAIYNSNEQHLKAKLAESQGALAEKTQQLAQLEESQASAPQQPQEGAATTAAESTTTSPGPGTQLEGVQQQVEVVRIPPVKRKESMRTTAMQQEYDEVEKKLRENQAKFQALEQKFDAQRHEYATREQQLTAQQNEYATREQQFQAAIISKDTSIAELTERVDGLQMNSKAAASAAGQGIDASAAQVLDLTQKNQQLSVEIEQLQGKVHDLQTVCLRCLCVAWHIFCDYLCYPCPDGVGCNHFVFRVFRVQCDTFGFPGAS